jgi:hypothetical protein
MKKKMQRLIHFVDFGDQGPKQLTSLFWAVSYGLAKAQGRILVSPTHVLLYQEDPHASSCLLMSCSARGKPFPLQGLSFSF